MSWSRAAVTVIVCACVLPCRAGAAQWELGLLAGARFDGELSDPADFSPVALNEAAAFGAFGRVGLRDGVTVELVWSTSTAELDVSRARSVPRGLELRVGHFQAGVQLEIGQSRLRPFVGVAAGVSSYAPSSGAAEPELAFSVGGVLGAHWTLRERLRLRLEIRGFGARPDPEGGSFCSDPGTGVCAVRNRDGLFLQSQVGLGVSVVF